MVTVPASMPEGNKLVVLFIQQYANFGAKFVPDMYFALPGLVLG
jgi:hypothetical protein